MDSPYVMAAGVTIAIVVLSIIMLAWVNFCAAISDYQWWGFCVAIMPPLIALYFIMVAGFS